ncbi:MAG TPA: hypothetical protein VFU31_20995 [Candidatus Binatia bacterium]|nr:hypothetical protein [Candidatus Binatia bacterium]
MPIDINALLLQGRCYGCLSPLDRRRVYAAILCEIVRTNDSEFDCDSLSDGCVACLQPVKQAFLQVQLLCLLNQVDDPTFDCDPATLLANDPCLACLDSSTLLTLITTMAANALLAENPAAETDPNVLLVDHPCLACLDGRFLETRISLLLAAWLEQFQAVNIAALVAQCDCVALAVPGGQKMPLLPLQALQWAPVSESPPTPVDNAIALAGQTTDVWKRAGATADVVLLSGF